jgi:hypothetical protein
VSYSYNHYNEKKESGIYSSLAVSMPMAHERLDYHRGVQVDTLMSRNTRFWSVSSAFSYDCFKKGRRAYMNYRINMSAPSMTNLLNIRDDSNPLYVTLGNPNLKNTRTHNLWMYWRDKWGKTLFNMNANATITEHAVASGFIYDRETGVRTVRPENVNGNWQMSVSSDVDFPLDKNDRWRIKEGVSYNHQNSVDLSGTI